MRIRPSFKKRLALNVFRRYVKTQAKLHDLNYFFWECTLRCNINCQHCGSDCHKDVAIQDMPAEDFLKITAQVAKKYNPNKIMIVITGGEPLVRKDLEQVGLELYKQGYPWGFVTNGIALTRERYTNLLKSGLRSVTVSLDGMEASHNWLRGHKDGFNKAVDAVKLLVGTKDLVFDVVTCLNQRNFNELEKVRDLLISLGVRKWRIFTIDPIGRAKENPELLVNDEQFLSLMEFIKKTRQEGKIIASFGCEGFLGEFENEVRDGFAYCRAGINISSILVDGSISVCPNNSHKVVQGNIYKDDFLDVWENKYQLMRDKSWAKKGVCKDCREFKWCRGNGLHLWDFENDEVMICHYHRMEDAIKQRGLK
ncbi:MAG: radical SAM/SPASM domain-containing protein [Bacteroidetes bacterium GWF2_38_335]|nr:MAG: radical SAM/SPASM domain-containing protein [Bacteroidetes bacterium GWF2_38_335]OFY79770.1 MAG: radical SAM/SPASM domain-containing protein [Bacteroidetes bacterium RIFOXYA12_FULL_38_20]HBS88158.1 radical SAM/SPASM domain-containing protein [Bacteroidales bacterium]